MHSSSTTLSLKVGLIGCPETLEKLALHAAQNPKRTQISFTPRQKHNTAYSVYINLNVKLFHLGLKN